MADRCLYGVDKNPLAVEMAKLSLWLITLQKDRPFSFLDHALRAGDSLLGLAHIDQLLHWSLATVTGATTATFLTEPLRRALQRAIGLRRKIRATPVIDVRDAERKAGWLHESEEALGLVRLAADLLVAAALHPTKKRREELSGEFQYRISLAAEAWETVRHGGAGAPRGDGNQEELEALRQEADALLDGRQPFHWPLEFPEVFLEEAQPVDLGGQQAMQGFGEVLGPLFGALEVQSLEQGGMGFAAILGNPPFMGGRHLSGKFGKNYMQYLWELYSESGGQTDLCAYFVRRSWELKNGNSRSGFLVTNSISEGDTRKPSLEYILSQGGRLYYACKTVKWPGAAAVYISVFSYEATPSSITPNLDGITVEVIDATLASAKNAKLPYSLLANEGIAFKGTGLGGNWFITNSNTSKSLSVDKDLSDIIKPYINGQEFMTLVDMQPERFCIDFGERSWEEVQEFPELLDVMYVRFQTEAENLKEKPVRWWLHRRSAAKLYKKIKETRLTRVIGKAQTTKTWAFALLPTQWLFDQAIIIFADDRQGILALLQSSLHEEWSWKYGSTLKTDFRYSPSDIFDNFPFPACLLEDSRLAAGLPKAANLSALAPLRETLDRIGEAYPTHRAAIMLARQEGLTKTYNRFHSPAEASADIAELRRLHVAMDQAVAAAYGWGDLELGHGFHQTKQGLRYTISEAARRTVLDRLLALNHQRYAEEVMVGLHDKGAKKAKGGRDGKERPRKAAEGQGELF